MLRQFWGGPPEVVLLAVEAPLVVPLPVVPAPLVADPVLALLPVELTDPPVVVPAVATALVVPRRTWVFVTVLSVEQATPNPAAKSAASCACRPTRVTSLPRGP